MQYLHKFNLQQWVLTFQMEKGLCHRHTCQFHFRAQWHQGHWHSMASLFVRDSGKNLHCLPLLWLKPPHTVTSIKSWANHSRWNLVIPVWVGDKQYKQVTNLCPLVYKCYQSLLPHFQSFFVLAPLQSMSTIRTAFQTYWHCRICSI